MNHSMIPAADLKESSSILKRERRADARGLNRILIIAGAAVALYVSIGSLTWPLGRDQGIFAWVAQQILNGGTPYKDAWDIKGPLTYYCYACALFWSNSEWSIRAFDWLLTLTCAWLIWKLILKITPLNQFGACCGSIYFLCTYYGGGYWNTAQPDAWAGFLIAMAVYLLIGAEPAGDRRKIAASGFLFAAATLLKPTFLIFLALPVLHWGAATSDYRKQIGTKPYVACLLAFWMTVCAMLLFLHIKGALVDFVEVNRFLALTHAGTESRHIFLEFMALPNRLGRLGLLVPVLLAPAAFWHLYRRDSIQPAVIIFAWLSLAIVMVIAQGKYWLYHWVPCVIALAVSTGIALEFLSLKSSVGRRWQLLAPAAFLAVVIPSSVRAIYHGEMWPVYAVGLQSRSQYEARFHTPEGTWRFPIFRDIATYIEAHSRPNDSVLIWGWDVLVNALAHRPTPSRFGYSYPLTIDGPLRNHYREVFLRELRGKLPKYIVVDARNLWELPAKSGVSLLRDFPELNSLILGSYRRVTTIGDFQVWKVLD